MRFLRNPHRDARLLKLDGPRDLASTGRGHSINPNMRAGTSAIAESYGTMHGNETTMTFSANEQYGAGIFICGPGNDGDLWKYYRIIITACTFNNHLHPIPVTGVGPATISTNAAGNQLSSFQHMGAPLPSNSGNSLMFDELVKVQPFTGSIATRPICFGVVIYNDHTSNITQAAYNYSISVAREHGDLPDAIPLHDI